MTFAELERAMRSKRRVEKIRSQERASFDYVLADLIGKSVSRIHSSANKMPDISEAYPSLFDSEEVQEQKAEQKAEVSALRFKLFAQSFNQRFHKEASNN
jgi:hypothetical protein